MSQVQNKLRIQTHLDKTLKDISPDKLEIYQLFYSLLPAQKVRIVEEMKKLKLDNEELLREAKEERVAIINEARKIREKMLDDARARGNEEADRIVESAKQRIQNERNAAIVDIKNEIADISIQIAEKVLREKMSDAKAQKEFVNKLISETNLN